MVIDKTPWLKIKARFESGKPVPAVARSMAEEVLGERFVRAGRVGVPMRGIWWRETTSSATREWSHEQSGCPGAGDSRRPGCSHRLLWNRHRLQPPHLPPRRRHRPGGLRHHRRPNVRDARFGTAARIRRRIAEERARED